jgi:hypothetical protein
MYMTEKICQECKCKFVRVHNMKAYKGAIFINSPILTSKVDGSEWIALHVGCLTCRERGLDTPVGPTDG